MTATIKDEIRKQVEEVKSQSSPRSEVNISSSDVADFARKQERKQAVKVDGPVEVPVSDRGKVDMLMAAASDPQARTRVAELAAAARRASVVIDDDDKNAFIGAVITGKRFARPFSLFGGRISGVFRSRSQSESRAVIARLLEEQRSGEIVTDVDYSSRLQAMLLAAQVQELNGTEYEEMAKPYRRTETANGTEEPGWLGQVERFEADNSGVMLPLYEALTRFEDKYWTMIELGEDQNFWNPEESS